MKDNYNKAYTEVIEILKYLPNTSISKIPPKMLEMFEIKKDKEYEFKIDINKSFEEQELLEETQAILANIFRDYWATPEQKAQIQKKEILEKRKIEEEKFKKYNPNDIFKNNKQEINNAKFENTSNNSLDNLPKETFYNKLINTIKKWFKL